MARAIAIKDEWLDAVSSLPIRAKNEAIGAIYTFLLTGEKTEVSRGVELVLSILWPFIESAKKISETNKANVSARYKNRSASVEQSYSSRSYDVPTTVATTVATKKEEIAAIQPSNGDLSEEAYGELSKENEAGESSSPLPPTTPISSIQREHVYSTSLFSGDKESNNAKAKYAFDMSFIESEEMREVVELWLQYKRGKGQTYKTQQSFSLMVKRLISLSGGDPGLAKEIIDEAISLNYSGFFELKTRKNNGSYSDIQQRLGLGGGRNAEYKPDYSESSIPVSRY